jgi:membrane protein implicated in regulation of membrane protease activity
MPLPSSTLDYTIGSMPFWFGLPLFFILLLILAMQWRRAVVVRRRAEVKLPTGNMSAAGTPKPRSKEYRK